MVSLVFNLRAIISALTSGLEWTFDLVLNYIILIWSDSTYTDRSQHT